MPFKTFGFQRQDDPEEVDKTLNDWVEKMKAENTDFKIKDKTPIIFQGNSYWQFIIEY
ncbi:MAG: hypothetical protein WC470_02615 [Candidatus Paceibacterota bacterium]